MAISPFNFGAKKNSVSARSPHPAANNHLSLSQALTITAGLAGLIGLCSGVIIRFSLANSPNARFLSPLQTFPTLSNWTPETSSGNTDNRSVQSRDNPQVENFEKRTWAEANSEDEPFEAREDDVWPEEATPRQASQALDSSTFDTFANRREEGAVETVGNPWKRLEEGPQVGRSNIDKENLEDGKPSSYYKDDSLERNYYEKAYDDPKDEPQYEMPFKNDTYRDDLEVDSRAISDDVEGTYPLSDN
ncbi:MAG: hypothetical protein AB8B99_08985 [Phormidesmis sp.]